MCIGDPADLFFEDICLGERTRVGNYLVDVGEIIAFGRKWDPLPHHIDTVAATHSIFGGLTAPGALILAIKQLLVHELPVRNSVVCSFGMDEVRFLVPLRPEDRVCVEVQWLEKRRSTSKPGCGVVSLHAALINNREEIVVHHKETVLMRLRNPTI